MKIPRKEFFRKVYCNYCGIKTHTIFFLLYVFRKRDFYIRFHKRCHGCGNGSIDEIVQKDFEALVKNEYL